MGGGDEVSKARSPPSKIDWISHTRKSNLAGQRRIDLRCNIAHNSPTINSTAMIIFASLLVEATGQVLSQESLWGPFKFQPEYLPYPRVPRIEISD